MLAEEIPSLITDLLQTCRIPSSSETALIRTTYWETHSSISRLDDAVSQLLNQRQALHNYRQTLGALLSPVQRLPPELLGEIFELCLPENYYKRGAHQAVMLPSHVCRHWRSVALSIPRLWSKFFLYVSDRVVASRVVASKTALVTAWLSRSGGSSLSITLIGNNVRPILDVILLHCDRWQHINLRIPSETLPCFEQASNHFDLLETLQISSNSIHVETFHPPRRIFESAPKLRTLSLSRFTWKSFDIPWAQITDFDAGASRIRVSECLEMLQCFANLQKLRIRLWHGDADVSTLRPVILDFHSLISLSVWEIGDVWDSGGVGALFDHLTLPNLRDLVIDYFINEWPKDEFVSFLSRSSPPLRNFSVGSSDNCMADNNLIEILQHTPSLISLTLDYYDCEACMGGSLLDRLSARMLENGEIDCLIPKLETIFVELPGNGDSPPFEAFTNMIISRCRLADTVTSDDSDSNPIGRIQSVKVDVLDRKCIDELLEGLAPLQGLVSDVFVDAGDAQYTLPAYPTPSHTGGEDGPYFKGPWRTVFS